jgi:hypothetical protein
MLIEINNEMATEIVIQEIKRVYEMNMKEIHRLKAIEKPKMFEAEDLEYCVRLDMACETMLKYYMVESDAVEYIDGVNNHD